MTIPSYLARHARLSRRDNSLLLVCATTAASTAATGCTSLHRVSPMSAAPSPPSWHVEAGDSINVAMQDGRRVSFTVKRVDAAAIIAVDDTRCDAGDIVAVDRREISGLETGFPIAGLAAGIVWVVLVHALLSSP